VDQSGIWSDPLVEPVINNPGAYRNVCVELEMYGLVVAAIMCSSLLDNTDLTVASKQAGNFLLIYM
jgi:Domain of unknown function (DUF1744)